MIFVIEIYDFEVASVPFGWTSFLSRKLLENRSEFPKIEGQSENNKEPNSHFQCKILNKREKIDFKRERFK
jgi:hypothetical protein